MELEYAPLSYQDLEWARQLHNDPEVLGMLNDPTVVSPEQQISWYNSLTQNKTSFRVIVKTDNKNIGLIRLDSLDIHNKSICIGLDIHKEFRGLGYSKIIYKYIMDQLFLEKDLHRIWLHVAEYNTRAYSLYQKLGFSIEGVLRDAVLKNNQYYNCILISIQL